jgi:hypothetical protein
MKNVEKSTLQGWTESIGQGLAKKLGILALGAAFLASPMASSTATAAGSGAVTHLECLQWIAQMVGDQLPATATSSDYVQWAQAKGMSPNGGWQPGAKLTKQAFAQILVQLFNLKENKYGGDYVRILAREGIYLPDEEEITRQGIVKTADDPVAGRLFGASSSNDAGKTTKPKNPTPEVRPPGGTPSSHKVTICHKGKNTISVDRNALDAHLAHGDTIGACQITQTQNP